MLKALKIRSNILPIRDRLHPNMLAIALANKRARTVWAVLSHDCDFSAKDYCTFRLVCSRVTMPRISIHFTPFATVCYAHTGQ
jgi:hypothetical protein